MSQKKEVRLKIRWLIAILALAFVLGGFASTLVAAEGGPSPKTLRSAPPAADVAALPAPPESLQQGFAPIVANATPAVVNISSSRTIREVSQSLSPFFDDPFFRRFFGDPRRQQVPRERRERSLGSGVVVGADGYILTNNHVVEDADQVTVAFADRRELSAEIVGTDPKIDIAVLKVEADDLPTMKLGDSSRVKVGEFVLAIGNPFGLGQTVTLGIVSATGRGNLGIEDYEDFIQTDAAINPGNSGGALIDVDGNLVGINTAILSRGTPGNVGVGFAVPINMARQAMDQILDHGRVIRGYLGVLIQPVTREIADAFGLDEPRGALIGDVTPDSPAERAGLVEGDIVLALDGQPIVDSRDLQLEVAQTAPGTEVTLRIFRDGRKRDVALTLEELTEADEEAAVGGSGDAGAPDDIAVDELTPQIARQLGLPGSTAGVVVSGVGPGSPWESAGLRRGDVIEEVNRQPVTSVREFERAVSRTDESSNLLLLVNRSGSTLYVVVERG